MSSLFHESIGPRIYDALMALRSFDEVADDRVILVVKEPQDELWLNRRFWPRSIYGTAIERLGRLGTRAVGMDILLRGGDETDDEDRRLVRALEEHGGSVLASCFGHGGEGTGVASLEEPAAIFRRAARSTGAINLQTTGRSMVRSIPLALKLDGRPLARAAHGVRGELVPAFALSIAFVATGASSVDELFLGVGDGGGWRRAWNRLFEELEARKLARDGVHPADALEAEGVFPLLEAARAATPRLRMPAGTTMPAWLATLPSVERLRRGEQARLLLRRLVRSRQSAGASAPWWAGFAEASGLVDRLVERQPPLPADPEGTPGGVDSFSRLRLDFEGRPGELFHRVGFRMLCRDSDYYGSILDPVLLAGELDELPPTFRGRIATGDGAGRPCSFRLDVDGTGEVSLLVVHLESGAWAHAASRELVVPELPVGELRWFAWLRGPAGTRRAEGRLAFDGRPGLRELPFGEGRVCGRWKPGTRRRIELLAHDGAGRPLPGDPVTHLDVMDLESGHRVELSGKGSFEAAEGLPAGRCLLLARTDGGRSGVFSLRRHRFCGAAALIGTSLRYEQDFYPVPTGGGTGQEMAGVAIQGQAVANLLGRGGIRSPDARVVLPATLGLFVLLSLASVAFSFPVLVGAWICGIILPLASSAMLMTGRRTWFDPEGAATLMLCGFVAFTVQRVLAEQREAWRRKAIFGKFVNPHMVDRILGEDGLVLDGERRDVTVLFSDIRSFTTISEELEPGDVSRMLNEYFNRMTPVLLRHEGTFDKFIGDAVMGFFGAPVIHEDHPLLAVRAAWEMLHENRKLQREWEGRDDVPWPTFRIGFGLATGLCQVGLIGSKDVANYTVLGDTVNLAARLESLNSKMGTELLISAATYERVKDHVEARKVEKVDVKGKKEPVDVYQVLEVRDG